ncbi:hypothetical protein LTR15_012139 [Elasticomyces elasticus]|nr:hypothetical protein LTR15_012139 [Elasticomyces elasticus]
MAKLDQALRKQADVEADNIPTSSLHSILHQAFLTSIRSTFRVEVGTPFQSLRLLPGTSAFSGNAIWVILAEGCWEANPGLPNCASIRGETFTRNASTTWSTQRLANGGLYQLPTYEEQPLGLTGSAYYGFDTVELGLDSQGLPTLSNQLVAGIATDNYFVGSLGLSPFPFMLTNSSNISGLNDPVPSLLGTLRNQSFVQSSSWAYTAGAFFQTPPVYGSLTFGGYDETRFDPNKTLNNIAFSGDTSRDLQLQLHTITYNTLGSSPLLVDSVYVFIDSLASQIWLPTAACRNFETAFNLTWDSSTSLYLIDESVHNTLLAQKPVFKFTLGGGDSNSETVDILLPYAAFDLNVTLPIVNGNYRYFPLKRADNATQYTLGRVFLQEAYIVADYDRKNFSVSQALFPPASVARKLTTICAPGNEAACKQSDKALGTGGIAGIVVGCVAFLGLLAASLEWLLWKRRKAHAKTRGSLPGVDEKIEPLPPSEPLLAQTELESREAALYEMDQRNEFRPELGEGRNAFTPELDEGRPKIKDGPSERQEMGSSDVAAYELEAPVPR